MIGFRINYKVLWDNDEEGIATKNKAITFFGEEQAKNRFFTLPNKGSKRILQDLFHSDDWVLIKSELGLNKEVSFTKTIACLYFSNNKKSIVDKLSDKTKNNFAEVFGSLAF